MPSWKLRPETMPPVALPRITISPVIWLVLVVVSPWGRAEKHYTNKSYKMAPSEYEKFLTLYEKSPGAQEAFRFVIEEYPEHRIAVRSRVDLLHYARLHQDEARQLSEIDGEQAGEREKAIRTFQLTCKRYPKSGEASRAHARLQNNYNINVTLGGAEDE